MADNKIPELTNAVKNCFSQAQIKSHNDNRAVISTSYFLIEILEEGSVNSLIKSVGAHPDRILKKARKLSKNVPQIRPDGFNTSPEISPELTGVFAKMRSIMESMGDTRASLQTVIAALADAGDDTAQLLISEGVNKKNIIDAVRNSRSQNFEKEEENDSDQYTALLKYGEDLTDKAKRGDIDPVIGRDSETRRVMQILSRRTKNNPVIVGEPGTGKTTIVEGLARKIVANDCPEQLKDKKIVSLDLAALSAGAKYQGEFEERVKAVLSDIKKAQGQIITFIDEIHMIAGNNGDPMSLANMLKPMLARGEMHLIGATTLSEYRQFIEKDPALERRFQTVQADEPSVRDTIGILRGIKEKYELHHGVRIQDPALVACAELSKRYINGRFLPDKAIDLMDEAASRLKMTIDSTPESIEHLEQEVRNLQVEKIALQKENDERSLRRLKEVDDEISEKQEELSAQKTDWTNSREGLENIRILKERKNDLEREVERLERKGDMIKIADIKYEEIPEIEARIKEAEEEAARQGLNSAFLSEEVTADIVADVVSSWTGVSASRMSQSETDKILNLAEHLDQSVIGQPEATRALAQAIKRSRAGVSDPHRPIGSFLFSGPSGCGKTESAKALAEFLFDDPNAIVSFSMEEYSNEASINKLIGAPAGYVGFEDTPGLEMVRQKPSSVVLFDELEKAHDRVIITLLSVLEEGHITLNNGKEVDFTNTVIIFTSNLGASTASEVSAENSKENIMKAIEQRLRPEFINRLDAVIPFNYLTEENLEKIVDIQVRRLERTLEQKSIKLTTTPESRKLIAMKGYDPAYGARPVRRIVNGEVADILADKIIRGEIPEESNAIIENNNGVIDVRLASHDEFNNISQSDHIHNENGDNIEEVLHEDTSIEDDYVIEENLEDAENFLSILNGNNDTTEFNNKVDTSNTSPDLTDDDFDLDAFLNED